MPLDSGSAEPKLPREELTRDEGKPLWRQRGVPATDLLLLEITVHWGWVPKKNTVENMKDTKAMYRHMQGKHAGSNTNSQPLQGYIQTSMHAYIQKPKDQTRNKPKDTPTHASFSAWGCAPSLTTWLSSLKYHPSSTFNDRKREGLLTDGKTQYNINHA